MASNKCIFNDDPRYMLSLIGKTVEITTTNNKIYKGAIYVIDPDSKIVVLSNPYKDTSNHNLDFILYSSIANFNILEDPVNSKFLFPIEDKTDDEDKIEDKKAKKAKLKRWLEENLLEVQEDGDKLKVVNAFIEYPYGTEECFCDNKIVLERLKKIIENMPSDFA